MSQRLLSGVLAVLGTAWLSTAGSVPLSPPAEQEQEEVIVEAARFGASLTVNHYQEGMRRMRAGELEAATEEFRNSLRYDPNYIPTLLADDGAGS